MCDIFVAMGDATADGNILFAKNSDRPLGELQDVVALPAQSHATGAALACTHLTIPQADETYGVILSKPRWMWGAEMGANEHGVVIGNTAVWTNQPYATTGLLGMDLLRLGLERGASAEEALSVITDLLGEFGQGGNCAEAEPFAYHNAFIIADPSEAWLLETAGEYWAAEEIKSGVRSLSNRLSITGPGERRHPGLQDSDFAKTFADRAVEGERNIAPRADRVRGLCSAAVGDLDVETAQAILRDHEGNICMHGPNSETRGSQISVLSPGGSRHWFTEGPFPCEQDYRQFDFFVRA